MGERKREQAVDGLNDAGEKMPQEARLSIGPGTADMWYRYSDVGG